MKNTLIKMVVIVCVAVVSGAVYKQTAKPDFPWLPNQETIKSEENSQKSLEEAQTHHDDILKKAGIGLDAFVTLAQKGALVIDARDEGLFLEGHLATPYIINLTAEDERLLDISFVDQFNNLLMLEIPIVIYCEGADCDSSLALYVALTNLVINTPHHEIYLYEDGWEGITNPDYEIEIAVGSVGDAEFVIENCFNRTTDESYIPSESMDDER